MIRAPQLEDDPKKHFNHSTFRMGQKEIIDDIMSGKDVLGILPTGSGKSLCYQLPARLLDGATIVVSPLISLMMDQVKELKANNFKAVVALNSFMAINKRKHAYQQLRKYKLIYVSPELLQSNEFQYYLMKIKINVFVIDEAHCISQWGHEFRPDYLKLHPIIERLGNPTILALSATATATVQDDIMYSLNKPNINKHIYPMDRENIILSVKEVENHQEKIDIITETLSNFRVPTLIYFSSRRLTENVSHLLQEKLPNQRIAFYHGGMDQLDRIAIQQQFMNDQLDVICCTSAFGMGINKNDIRLVIHFHFPLQIESFIQEAGRAGRDGNASLSLLLYEKNDANLPYQMIQTELPNEQLLETTFKRLYNLFSKKGTLPEQEHEIESMFKLNEIQWRFLHYQLEKHGIIESNTIIYNRLNWEHAFNQINKFIKQRYEFKVDRLNGMLKWIQEKACLRKHLYKAFQSDFTKPATQCCSNCGFKLTEWEPNQTTVKDHVFKDWKCQLRDLLLIL